MNPRPEVEKKSASPGAIAWSYFVNSTIALGLTLAPIVDNPALTNLVYFVLGVIVFGSIVQLICWLVDAPMPEDVVPHWFVRVTYLVPLLSMVLEGWFWSAAAILISVYVDEARHAWRLKKMKEGRVHA